MTADDSHWQRLINGLRNGNETIAGEFYGHYRPLLERLAGMHLKSGLLRRVSPDEVAHSACRTFLRRIHGGEFELSGTDKLWNLLCAITLAKARKKARFHLADKRQVGKEQPQATTTEHGGAGPAGNVAAAAPTPAEAAEFADQFEHVLDSMDDEERKIVLLKLEQKTNDEIAAACQCAERTVRRLLKRVEARVIESLDLAS
jgi:RNA polymerase sigma factor (sigma-70 family)